MKCPSHSWIFAAPCALLVLAAANAREIAPKDLLTRSIDGRITVPLPSSVHPEARPELDAGPVAEDLKIARMKLVLHRSIVQQSALDTLLAAQQDLQSPEYHHWLTPEEFGSRFGLSQNDLHLLTAWLQQNGFTVDEIPEGRWTIVFSGTAGQLQTAFHTEIHYYNVNGTYHRANATPLRIPEALSQVVDGVAGIHDFRPIPAARKGSRPQLEEGSSHYLSASDYAAIYDISPLYAAGFDGSGQTIAITGVCDIDPSAVQIFRKLMGLGPNNTTVTVVGQTPAPCAGDDSLEPYLDVEWAGAVAKNAAINLVIANNLEDAAAYIVNNNLASVMSTSFISCEANNLGIGNQYWSDLWAQASASGITSLIASGDAGAAGCDDPHTESVAMQGLGVNAICSTPYDICVGGTQFEDASEPAQYWSGQGNATGYIPETAWNQSGIGNGDGLWATAGGYSAIYSKTLTSWQAGNSSSFRGVPDVSLSAASHDGYFVCEDSGCSLSSIYYAFGTSAAAPSFAGIMALVVQSTGQRQGNAGPALYKLAANSGLNAFHDITSGNNSVPGQQGYPAGQGWDPVTGLGSVDASALVTHWPGASKQLAVTLSVNSLSFGSMAVGVSSMSQSVTLVNSGSAALSLLSIGITGTNSGDFVQTGNCGNTLAAGLNCTIAVTFRPTASGPRAGVLKITDSAAGSPRAVSLAGTGQPLTVTSLNPASATAGATGFDLDILGASFVPGAAVLWNGTPLFTTYVSQGDLRAAAPASLLVTSGNARITVVAAGAVASGILMFTINPSPNSPFINAGGVVPVGSTTSAIQAGSWISIYGGHLAGGTFVWNNDFPTSLGGVGVTINGKPAYLWYVSPGLNNLQVPDAAAVGVPAGGMVDVVVTNAAGSATAQAALATVAPGFSVFDAKHVMGVIPTPNGSGAYADGTYDLLGPTGAFAFKTRPVKVGETLILYGVGFGSTNPPVPSGQLFSGIAPTTYPVAIRIGGVSAVVQFSGMVGAGLYQFNVVVPATGSGDQLLSATVDGASTQPDVYVTVQ